MVRISSQYLILALSSVGCVLGAPGRRDVAQVEADLATVQADAQTVLAAVIAFGCGAGTVAQLNAIQTATDALIAELDAALPDASSVGTITEPQCQEILDSITNAETPFFKMIDNYEGVPGCIPTNASNRAALQAQFNQNLVNLRAANQPFENTFLEICNLANFPPAK